jgi:hypothetical protein
MKEIPIMKRMNLIAIAISLFTLTACPSNNNSSNSETSEGTSVNINNFDNYFSFTGNWQAKISNSTDGYHVSNVQYSFNLRIAKKGNFQITKNIAFTVDYYMVLDYVYWVNVNGQVIISNTFSTSEKKLRTIYYYDFADADFPFTQKIEDVAYPPDAEETCIIDIDNIYFDITQTSGTIRT